MHNAPEPEDKRKLLKKLLWVAVGILFLVVFNYMSFAGGFDKYVDPLYGFSVSYPSDWQKVEHFQPGAAAVFISPKSKKTDKYRENFNITVQDIPPDVATVEAYTERATMQMMAVFPDITVESSEPITFGGRKGRRVLFSAEKTVKLKIVAAWTIKGAAKAYVLTFMTTFDEYKKYLPMVNYMIKSFRLTN